MICFLANRTSHTHNRQERLTQIPHCDMKNVNSMLAVKEESLWQNPFSKQLHIMHTMLKEASFVEARFVVKPSLYDT